MSPRLRSRRPVELRYNRRADLWQVWRGKDVLVATANRASAVAWLERNGYPVPMTSEPITKGLVVGEGHAGKVPPAPVAVDPRIEQAP